MKISNNKQAMKSQNNPQLYKSKRDRFADSLVKGKVLFIMFVVVAANLMYFSNYYSASVPDIVINPLGADPQNHKLVSRVTDVSFASTRHGGSTDWCDKMAIARADLMPSLAITYVHVLLIKRL